MGRRSNANDRLVRAAAALFLTRSYQSVGVDELCAAAGVGKGSFYHYFPTKSDLLKAVIDLHAQVFLDRFHEPQGPPLDRLRAVTEAIAATQEEFARRYGRVVGCPFGNLAAELSTTDEEAREHVGAVIAELERRLSDICRQVGEDGLLADGVKSDELAHALMASYQGTILLAKVTGSGLNELAAALGRVIDAHLRTAPPSRPA